MIPALRLTTTLLLMPVATAFALQVEPPVPPRTPVPRTAPAPRPMKPRAELPRIDGWELERKSLEWQHDLAEMQLEKLEKMDMSRFEKLEKMDMSRFEA